MRTTILLFGLFFSLSVIGQTSIPTDTYFSFPLDGNATDIGGDNRSGLITGGVTPTQDRLGNASGALQFNGTDGWIEIPYDVSVGTGDFTVTYWANPSSSNTGFVLTKEQNGLATNQFRIGSSGEYFCCFSDNTNTYSEKIPYVPTANVWSFYVITRHGNTMGLYVNGLPIFGSTGYGTINHSNNLKYRIGVSYWGEAYYNGKIDDLRMFKHVLTLDEMNALYRKDNPPKISYLSPYSGSVGSSVTIVGTDFSPTASDNIVYFGSLKATVISSTSTNINVAVPEGAVSVVPVTVTTKGKIAFSSTSTVPLFNITNYPYPELTYSKSNKETHVYPWNISAGDFNGDGKTDIVASNLESEDLSILIGDGNGGFATAVNYKVGLYPFKCAVSDFNGDGISDLVSPNYGSDNISVLIGNGNGTFISAVNYELGDRPSSVETDDFNADGYADLVVSNYGSSNVSILMGIGNGTFASPVQYSTIYQPSEVKVGDFNRDGKADLVTSDASYNISVFIGNGDGTFASGVKYPGGTTVINIADINKDSYLDLLVTRGIMYGDGSGNFSSINNYPSNIILTDMALADVNGDGNIDIVGNQKFDNKMVISLGNGNGTFSTPIYFVSENNPESLVVCDLNNDGLADIVSGRSSNSVNIFLNTSLALKVLNVSDIKTTSATVNGNVIALGTLNPNVYGFCWNTTGMPTTSDLSINNGINVTLGAYSAFMTDLLSNTKYYVRAYATNSQHTVYSNEINFTTLMKVGVDNVTQTLLSLTPNPATNGFNINVGEQKSMISIYDLSGNLVLSKQIEGKSYVDINSLSSGIYMVKANGLVGKLIKK